VSRNLRQAALLLLWGAVLNVVVAWLAVFVDLRFSSRQFLHDDGTRKLGVMASPGTGIDFYMLFLDVENFMIQQPGLAYEPVPAWVGWRGAPEENWVEWTFATGWPFRSLKCGSSQLQRTGPGGRADSRPVGRHSDPEVGPSHVVPSVRARLARLRHRQRRVGVPAVVLSSPTSGVPLLASSGAWGVRRVWLSRLWSQGLSGVRGRGQGCRRTRRSCSTALRSLGRTSSIHGSRKAACLQPALSRGGSSTDARSSSIARMLVPRE
jgi:hypothetical protein